MLYLSISFLDVTVVCLVRQLFVAADAVLEAFTLNATLIFTLIILMLFSVLHSAQLGLRPHDVLAL